MFCRLEVVRMNSSFGDRSFAAAAPRVWNSLPDAVRNDYLTLRITSSMCAIDATYQGGMGRAVGGIFTADCDTEIVFRK